LLHPHQNGIRVFPLTSREGEVIQLIAEGYATKQIADLLFVSKKTADKHRQGLMNKLNLHKVAALTRYAIAHGFAESNRVPNRPPDWPVTYPVGQPEVAP
jgi:DNA-binding NarL/FixJ family response regulator